MQHKLINALPWQRWLEGGAGAVIGMVAFRQAGVRRLALGLLGAALLADALRPKQILQKSEGEIEPAPFPAAEAFDVVAEASEESFPASDAPGWY